MRHKRIAHREEMLFLLPLLVMSVSFGWFQLRPAMFLSQVPTPTPTPTPFPMQNGPSGIDGTVTGMPTVSEPEMFSVFNYELTIKDATGKKIIKKIRTGKLGKFSVKLPEGTYTVVPGEGMSVYGYINGNQHFDNKAKVKVSKGYRTGVDFYVQY